MNLQQQKQQLINTIHYINDAQILAKLQEVLQEAEQDYTIMALAERPRKKIDIERLKREQGYDHKQVRKLRGRWFQGEDYLELLKLLEDKSIANYFASKSSLKKDWLKPEEDKAWQDL